MRIKGYKRLRIDEFPKSSSKKIYNIFYIKRNIIRASIIIIIMIIIIALFFLFMAFYIIHKKILNKNKTQGKVDLINNITIELNKDLIKSNKEKNDINKTNNLDLDKLKQKSEELTKEVQKFESTLRKITKQEINDFRGANNLNILYDKTKYKRSETPDISIVITMRNQAHCIHKAIRSVQNQSLKNIEMIIIDDCSLDNSTETVEEFMKEDERIILLKHDDNNEGIMITRNEGIRMAKGKYIAMLDADDTFIHKDILNYSLHVANLANLDVVEFYTALYQKNTFKGYYHFHGYLPIIYQPELKYKFIIFKDEEWFRPIKCRTVWSKIVRNEILQKTLDNIPSKYLYDYILGFEDTMLTVSLYQVAQSYYCLRQLGYYYTFDEKRNGFPRTKNKECSIKEGVVKDIDHIKYLQFLVDKLDDNELGKKILYHEIKAINNFTYSNFKRTITHHFDWVYDIFDPLINSSYLNLQQRENLQKIKDEIKENENNQKIN